MKAKGVLVACFVLVLIGVLSATLEIHKVEASTLIYIKEDGTVEPSAANITTSDCVTYNFTGNNNGCLMIERGNIVVDGFGYTLEGTNFEDGVFFRDISNVTIKDLDIREFDCGINICNSSNNKLYGNCIADNNEHGLYVSHSSNDVIYENNVTNNGGYFYTGYSSIHIAYSFNTAIFLNNITENTHLDGIKLVGSSNNTIYENNISDNYHGIRFFSSNNNRFFGNNITASAYEGISLFTSSNNTLYTNLLTGNKYGLDVYGENLSHYMNDINTSNLIDEKPIYYLINIHNETIEHSAYPDIGYLALVNSTSVNLKNLNLRNNSQGLLFAYTNNSRIAESNIANNYDGLVLFSSFNNTIYGNTITGNDYQGIYLWGYSDNNRILENSIMSNYYQGIYLSDSSNNTLYGNTLAHSEYAIELDGSYNSIYLNNFVNNTQQVDSYDFVNFWNNGFEGNYWSDYNGTDTTDDGVGEDPYYIDSNNNDTYPLMGMFHSFNTTLETHVNVISNSTLDGFQYFNSINTINLLVSNSSADQGFGFCRICIPHTLMNETYYVTVNGTEPSYVSYNVADNGTHRWIYFTYEHSTLEIVIIPEFPSLFIVPLFMLTTLIATIIHKRKH